LNTEQKNEKEEGNGTRNLQKATNNTLRISRGEEERIEENELVREGLLVHKELNQQVVLINQ